LVETCAQRVQSANGGPLDRREIGVIDRQVIEPNERDSGTGKVLLDGRGRRHQATRDSQRRDGSRGFTHHPLDRMQAERAVRQNYCPSAILDDRTTGVRSELMALE
jgi:hypothetical protein